METFCALLALCEGNSPVTSEFSSQRPMKRSFDVFFDLRLNKWLRKQSRWRCDLRRHRAHYNVTVMNTRNRQPGAFLRWQDNMRCLFEFKVQSKPKDHLGYEVSQWKATLQCNVVSHWLSPHPVPGIQHLHYHTIWYIVGLILDLRPADERRCYFVRTSLIGWSQT